MPLDPQLTGLSVSDAWSLLAWLASRLGARILIQIRDNSRLKHESNIMLLNRNNESSFKDRVLEPFKKLMSLLIRAITC